MNKVQDIKANIYGLLNSVTYTVGTVKVYQNWPTTSAEFPCVTFSVVNNSPRYALDKEINYQDVEISINFWASKPSQTSSMLSDAELVLRNHGYLLQTSESLIEEDGSSHIYTVFKFIV